MLNLTDRQCQLLRSSWASVAIDPGFAAQLFYGRLFSQRPELRAMFGDDMQVQGRKLMDTLNFVIDHLEKPEVLEKPVRDLGVRHQGYGVDPADYGDVGEALVWTFQNILKDDFKDETKAVWIDAYTQIANAMTAPQT